MLVGYAAFKKHCSLFPTGSGVLDQFEKELQGLPHFQGDDSVSAGQATADALIKKIVKARVRGKQGVGLTRSRRDLLAERCYTVTDPTWPGLGIVAPLAKAGFPRSVRKSKLPGTS